MFSLLIRYVVHCDKLIIILQKNLTGTSKRHSIWTANREFWLAEIKWQLRFILPFVRFVIFISQVAAQDNFTLEAPCEKLQDKTNVIPNYQWSMSSILSSSLKTTFSLKSRPKDDVQNIINVIWACKHIAPPVDRDAHGYPDKSGYPFNYPSSWRLIIFMYFLCSYSKFLRYVTKNFGHRYE